VIIQKRTLYVKNVQTTSLPVDKFGGVNVAWSRFGGSCKQALQFVAAAGFWKEDNE
jgi:hypothetical protein